MRIIDCHCHIYPEKIAVKARNAIGDFYKYKMENKTGTAEALLAEGGAAGITDYIVHSVATTPGQVRSVNGFIAAEVAAHKEFTGFGTLHPDSTDQKGDIADIVSKGLRGIKIHPDFIKMPVDHPKFMHIFELLSTDFADRKLPVCIHCGDKRYDNTNPDRVRHVLESFPDVTVIGAHFGGHSVWDEAAEKLPGYSNLYVDTSSSFGFMKPEKCNQILRAFDINRILLGTDFPMWLAEKELNYLYSLDLTEEEKELILHKNAETLLGI